MVLKLKGAAVALGLVFLVQLFEPAPADGSAAGSKADVFVSDAPGILESVEESMRTLQSAASDTTAPSTPSSEPSVMPRALPTLPSIEVPTLPSLSLPAMPTLAPATPAPATATCGFWCHVKRSFHMSGEDDEEQQQPQQQQQRQYQQQQPVTTPKPAKTSGFFYEMRHAFAPFLLGLILFAAAFPIIWLNEQPDVANWKLFGTARRVARANVFAHKVSIENDAKLVHVVGDSTAESQIIDQDTGIAVNDCLVLERTVHMYQWQEHKQHVMRDTAAGHEASTIFKYVVDWSDVPVDSSEFRHQTGHENPKMQLVSKTFFARAARLGAFQLPPELLGRLGTRSPLADDELPVRPSANWLWSGNFHMVKGERGCFYTTEAETGGPQVGDLRVSYKKVPTGRMTVLAVQNGNTFGPWNISMASDAQAHHYRQIAEHDLLLGKEEGDFESLTGLQQQVSPKFASSTRTLTTMEPDCTGTLVSTEQDPREIFELLDRDATITEVLAEAQGTQESTRFTMVGVGLVLLFTGLEMQFYFVPSVLGIYPLVGMWTSLFGTFTPHVAALLLSLAMICIIIAAAWITMRVLKSLLLFVVAAAFLIVPTVIARSHSQ